MSPRSFVLALASAPLLALAQNNPNPFNVPETGLSATGGQPLNLEWNPTTDGTVSLILRSGSSNNLEEGTVIASSIDNDGSYTWTPSDDLTRGSDYTIQIVSDSDESATNYTPYFVLDTTNTVAYSTGIVSSAAPSSTPDVSSADPTGSATSVLDATTTESASTASSTEDSDSSQTTSMPSSSMDMMSSAGAMTQSTVSGSDSSSMSMTGSSTAASSTGSSSTASASASQTSVQNINDDSGAGSLKISAGLGLMAAVACYAIAF